MKIAVLMTCYNRCVITCSCLRHLFSCKVSPGVALDVWLNDDGSTDGTSEMVAQVFPSVKVVHGRGCDFWCGGMRRVWAAAAASGIPYDGYLWLNDDTLLHENAITSMLSGPENAIVVGAVAAPAGTRMTYGGRNSSGKMLLPTGEFQLVTMMNGNCVYVPQMVFEELGNFPNYLTHALGDFDYSLRAKEHHILVVESAEYVGVCDDQKKPVPWMMSTYPLIKRLENLYSPCGGPEPLVFFRYNRTHFGLCRAIRMWVQQHVRVCFPSLWRLKK